MEQHLKTKKELDKNFDISRSKFQVLSELQNNNNNIFPGTYFFDFFNKFQSLKYSVYPFAGISNSKTISCNELGYWPIISRDKYGFSNSHNFYNEKIDYLLVGDSFAEGWCVNEENNLQNIFNNNNKKTLSLGISGSGPLLQLATLKEYKKVIQPKQIIMMYYEGNDLKNLDDELNNVFLKKYLNNDFSQGLIYKQKEIDYNILDFIKKYYIYSENNVDTDLTYSNIYYRIVKLSNIRLLLNLISSSDIKFKNQKSNTKLLLKYEDIIDEFKEIANELNSELYFLYIPDWTRVKQRKIIRR